MKFKSDVQLESLNNATTDTDKFLVSDGSTVKYRTGAQVLSDIGGQSALTNPITGTGTTNYVSKFTGASTLGNSQIFDNGTNVGVGTITPNTNFEIKGKPTENTTLRISTNGAGSELGVIQFYRNSASSGTIFYEASGGGNQGITIRDNRSDGASNIIFSTNGSNERMRINSSGNVGIGTTAPAAKLHVYHNDTGIGDANGITIEQNGSGDSVVQYLLTGVQRWVTGIDNSDLDKFKIASSIDLGTDARLTIDTTGNVGIGTTSPSSKLDVSGYIQADTYAAGTTVPNLAGYLRLLSAPKTGWAPGDELGKIEFYGLDTSGVGPRNLASIRAINNQGNGTTTTVAEGELAFYTSAYNALESEKVRIDGAGNVGIGTSSPDAKLTVNGWGRFTTGILTGNWSRNNSVYSFANGILIQTDISATADNNMIQLEVTANTYSNGMPLKAQYQCYNYLAGGTIISAFGLSTHTNLVVDVFHYNGFVCFWMPQPSGNSSLTFDLYSTLIENRKITSITNVIKPTTGVTNSVTITPKTWYTSQNLINPTTGTGTTNYVSKFTGATSLGNSQIFDNGTNVGIGTTSPSTKLDLVGTDPGIRQSVERTSGGVAFSMFNLNAKNTTSGLSTSFGSIGVYGNLNVGPTPPSVDYIYMGADSTTAHNNNTFRLYPNKIANFQGNVGVGTTVPGVKLHVGGASGELLRLEDSSATGNPYMSFYQTTSRRAYIQYVDSGDNLTLVSEYGGIRFLAGGGAPERMRITSGGYVGIGETSPSSPLSVTFNDNAYATGLSIKNTNTGANSLASIGFSNNTTGGYVNSSLNLFNNGDLDILVNNGAAWLRPRGNTAMYVDYVSSVSRVTIGNGNTASHPLRVTQQVSNVSIYADYDIVAYSDKSVKENIRPIENVIERIQNSRGVVYDRIDSGAKDNIGFIAQELEENFPELVTTNEDGTKAVKYQNTVAVLFEAIKEQQKQIDELKNIINGLTK